MTNKSTAEKRKRKLKGRVCWLCGNEDNLTVHHLRCNPKSKEKREELDTFLYNGECIPLCRECHIEIELLQSQRKLLKKLVKNLRYSINLI